MDFVLENCSDLFEVSKLVHDKLDDPPESKDMCILFLDLMQVLYCDLGNVMPIKLGSLIAAECGWLYYI